MSAAQTASIALTLGWLVLVWLIPLLRAPHRRAAFAAMVLTGVPLLGWLTLHWGPVVGVTGFALGLLALTRRSRHPRHVPRRG